MKKKNKIGLKRESIGFCLFAGIMAIICFIPFWIVFAASISTEQEIVKNGFSFLIQKPTIMPYSYIITKKGMMLLRAFGITIAAVALGTIYSVSVNTLFAYAIAQPVNEFRFANALSFIAWFTTVFTGGVLPWYILCTKYYGLKNNLFALFIPYGLNVFYMFILKSGFKALPKELIEAARIDGASNFIVFQKIALPLNKVGIVTIVFFTALQLWNDFYLSLYLITATDMYTVQKLLYNMMSNISQLMSGTNSLALTEHITIPTNTIRMAMTMFTVLPVVAVFPFAQKYFVKGITVGAVKG